MKGKILDYDFQNSKGVISGDDGNRYYFENSEWKGNTNPKTGQTVDFETDGQNAKGVYLVQGSISIDGVVEKLEELNASEKIDGIKNRLIQINKNGVQNRMGLVVSLVLMVFIFVPISSINEVVGHTHTSIANSKLGTIVF